MKKAISIRIETDLLQKVSEIAKAETEKLNYKITKTAVMEKALTDFIKGYKLNK